MKVELSNATVTLKESLTWSDYTKLQYEPAFSIAISDEDQEQKSQDSAIDFEQLKELGNFSEIIYESKLRLFEHLIKEINEGGNSVEYSEDWVSGLSKADGEKLEESVNDVIKQIQKNE